MVFCGIGYVDRVGAGKGEGKIFSGEKFSSLSEEGESSAF